MPDWSKPFILDTNACDTGIGPVSSQSNLDGNEHVVAYASKLLTKPERNYFVTCKELLAVVTFPNQFWYYLIDRPLNLQKANWLDVLQDHCTQGWE